MLAFADVNPLAVLSAPRMLDEHPMQRTRNLRKCAEKPDQQRQTRYELAAHPGASKGITAHGARHVPSPGRDCKSG
jgi:hypothetical protein